MSVPLPLDALETENLRAIFTDLDETLTENGKLSPQTHRAIASCAERGLPVVIVTGRSAGWADCLVRLLPLDAVIFESGAGWLRRCGSRIELTECTPSGDRAEQRRLLTSLYERVKKKVPAVRFAADQPYRLFDFALEHGEEPPYLSPEELSLVIEILRGEPRVTVQRSSVHVNYWYGKHDKSTACRQWLESHGKARGLVNANIVYCGDAPNDEPLFGFFVNTVGVANIAPYLPAMQHHPKYITRGDGGAGFRELVKMILARSPES